MWKVDCVLSNQTLKSTISLLNAVTSLLEKIYWKGEFNLRRDPLAGFIAFYGSFYPMVCLFFRAPWHSSVYFLSIPVSYPLTPVTKR